MSKGALPITAHHSSSTLAVGVSSCSCDEGASLPPVTLEPLQRVSVRNNCRFCPMGHLTAAATPVGIIIKLTRGDAGTRCPHRACVVAEARTDVQGAEASSATRSRRGPSIRNAFLGE